MSAKSNADSRQVSGTHYTTEEGGVQHWTYCIKQEVPNLEYASSKYTTRWKRKNGLVDLQKAVHYLEKRLECVYLCGAMHGARKDEELFTRFLCDNNVPYPESLIIDMTIHWTSTQHLDNAIKLLSDLIEKTEAAEQMRGYVNQG